jgi:hypothetical protein
MKPLNADQQGCDPISSNCVIWQGPDIECIGLCKGDSVSAVVAKLGNELCTVLTSLNIDTYDISCLEIGNCGPENFEALIQLLIDKICGLETSVSNLENTSGTGTGGTSNPVVGDTATDTALVIATDILAGNNVPNAVIATAEPFWYTNPTGDTVKQMQIVDYVAAAGNKIATIGSEMRTVQETLVNHSNRISDLENTPEKELALPNMAPVCVAPVTPLIPLDQFTMLLEQQFCALRTATGNEQDLYEAILKQCVGLNDADQLQGPGKMNQIDGWRDDITNVSDSLVNLWLGYCDVRAAMLSMQAVVITSSCDDLDIEVSGLVTANNKLSLFYSGTYPTGYVETEPVLLKITDSDNNSLTISTTILPYLNTVDGYSVDLETTPINSASNLIVNVPMTFGDGSSVCQKVVTEVIINTGICPTVNITPLQESLDWTYTYLGGAASLNMVLYDQTGTSVLANQIDVVTGPETISNIFGGLTAGLQYKMRLEITPSGTSEPTLCPFSGVTTLANVCLPPMNLTGQVIIT